jgi:peptidoglycan/LPS O-acetylase OafA/YrhL
MLAITLFATRFLLMPGDYKALADSTATAAFGVSNFFFLANTGYFDQAADLMPLLHTWSLAVEEQFYVVWPLFLFVIAAGRHRIDVAAIIGGIVILGFGASLVWFDLDPKSAFFMALPRAWELAIGAALVFLPPLPRFAGETATALGIVLIGAGFLFVTAASFPGVAALFPCLGAALVIWPRRDSTTAASWLGHLSPIGLISYSLYLWHWPVWVLFRIYINNGTPRIREAAALALVSIALATLSWRFVERPFRKRRWQPGQTVWARPLRPACSSFAAPRTSIAPMDSRKGFLAPMRCEAAMSCLTGRARKSLFHPGRPPIVHSEHRGLPELRKPSYGAIAMPNTSLQSLKIARRGPTSRSRSISAVQLSLIRYPAIQRDSLLVSQLNRTIKPAPTNTMPFLRCSKTTPASARLSLLRHGM